MSCRRFSPAIRIALFVLSLPVFGYASSPCPLDTTNPSVTICTPALNDLVQSPVHVVAGTTDSNLVTTMWVYVDNQLAYKVNASTVDTTVSMPVGHHAISISAIDSTKTFFRKNVPVVMQPPCRLTRLARWWR